MSVPPQILEALGLQVEHRRLIIGFDRRKIQCVAKPAVDGDPICGAPCVLHKEFLRVGAVANLIILHVDREALDLPTEAASAIPY